MINNTSMIKIFERYNSIYLFYILSILTILITNLPFYEWGQLLISFDIKKTGTYWSPLDHFQDGLIYLTLRRWDSFTPTTKINISGVYFHVFATLIAFLFFIYFTVRQFTHSFLLKDTTQAFNIEILEVKKNSTFFDIFSKTFNNKVTLILFNNHEPIKRNAPNVFYRSNFFSNLIFIHNKIPNILTDEETSALASHEKNHINTKYIWHIRKFSSLTFFFILIISFLKLCSAIMHDYGQSSLKVTLITFISYRFYLVVFILINYIIILTTKYYFKQTDEYKPTMASDSKYSSLTLDNLRKKILSVNTNNSQEFIYETSTNLSIINPSILYFITVVFSIISISMNVTTVISLFFIGSHVDFYMASIEMVLVISFFLAYIYIPLINFCDYYSKKDFVIFSFILYFASYLFTIFLLFFYALLPAVVNNILVSDTTDLSFFDEILNPIPHFYLHSLLISLILIIIAKFFGCKKISLLLIYLINLLIIIFLIGLVFIK